MSFNRVLRVTVIIAIMFATTRIFAQPVADRAEYNENTNEFWIYFDSNIFIVAKNVVYTGMMLDDDNGGKNQDFAFRGGTIINTTGEGNILKFVPYFDNVIDSYEYTNNEGTVITANCWGNDYADLLTIETMMEHDNMTFYLPNASVLGIDGMPNQSQWIDCEYIPTDESDKVTLNEVNYDAYSNTLQFIFSGIVQFDQIPEDISQPHPVNNDWDGPGNGILDNLPADDLTEDRNDNGVLDFESNVYLPGINFKDINDKKFTPNSALDITGMDNDTLEMKLSLSYRAAFEQLDQDSIKLSFDKYTFMDTDYNPVVGVEDFPVNVIPDPDPIFPDSALYDIGQNQIRVWFNQELDPDIASYIVMPKIWIKCEIEADTILVDSTGVDSLDYLYIEADTLAVFISGGNPGIVDGNLGARITMKVPDSKAVEDFYFMYPEADFYVQTTPNAVISQAGNGNILEECPMLFALESTSSKAPEVDEASYDAYNQLLYVKFDVRLDLDVNLSGFSFLMGENEVTLSGGSYERTSGNKALNIILTSADKILFENYAERANALLKIQPYTVLQQNKLNGNRYIETELEYISDTNFPLPEYVYYDFVGGKLVLGTKPVVDAEHVDLSKMVFAGHRLSPVENADLGADSVVLGDSDHLIYMLNDEDVQTLNGLDDSAKDNISIDIDAGFIVNFDGVLSEAYTGIQDKNLFPIVDDTLEITVGYGRDYYLHAFQVFPSLPRKIHASIREVSNHAYWFVANEQIKEIRRLNGVPHVNADSRYEVPMPAVIPFKMAELDSAVKYFEEKTPMDSTRGAYEQIMEVFAKNYSEVVPDKINILFADVYDDYGEAGRNDSKAGYWKHGYFLPADLPGSNSTYSNHSELIILDTYPQSYNIEGENVWKWDKVNDEWDPGDAESVKRGLPAIANIFTEYLCYKVDPFDAAWTRKGLAYLSEFLVDSQPEFYGETVAKGISGGNILTTIGADYNSRVDYIHLYMFYLYLFEKYGGWDLITTINESPYVGMTGIEKILNERQELLDEWLRGKNLREVYRDFATANLLDTIYAAANDHGIYNFENINTRASVRGSQLKWKPRPEKDKPPYAKDCPQWGVNYYYTSYGEYDPNLLLNPDTDQLVVFAGQGSDDMLLRKVNVRANNVSPNLGGEYSIQEFDGDNWDDVLNRGVIPMSPGGEWTLGPDPDDFAMWVLVACCGGEVNITNEVDPSEYSSLYIAQNPTLSRKLDLYVVSELPIYNSDGEPAPMLFASRDEAGEDVIMTFDTEEDFIITSQENDLSKYNMYLAGGWITEPGTFFWHLDGYYSNGLRVEPTTIGVGINKIPAGQPGQIKISDKFHLYTGTKLAENDLWVSVIETAKENRSAATRRFPENPDKEQLGSVYTIISHKDRLDDPATIRFKLDSGSYNADDTGIYLLDGDIWRYAGGLLDTGGDFIQTRIDRFGTYGIFKGEHGQVDSELAIPSDYSLKQNYPNPFNPATTISFSTPVSGHVSLMIYDILGRQVAELIDRDLKYGVYNVIWNAEDENNTPLSSGVYFLHLRTGEFQDSKKMLLIK